MDSFENNKIFITSFIKILWEYPELISEIIINAEYNTFKNNLSHFFINNFYMNYLDGDFLENNLLYITTLLIQNELSKINKMGDWDLFLEISNTGLFLTSLCKVPNIHLYFKNIINNAIDLIERNNLMDELFICEEENTQEGGFPIPSEKKKEKKNLNVVYKRIKTEKIDLNFKNIKKINENYKIFVEKYSVDVKMEQIMNYKNKAEKEKKDILYNYYKKIEEEIKIKNEDFFSNKKLMAHFLNSNSPTYLLSFYQNEFLKRVNSIEQLIFDFEKNILIMPKFIKSICRIIMLLLKKKFPNITKLEENLFISKFILNKLLIYFLSSPNLNALIHNFIISESTLKEIKMIIMILKYIFSGKLFKNNDEEYNYTPYNWLILEKLETVINIFENSKKIKLPNFIENYIDKKLPSDYSYDYFKENEEKIYTNISICFTLDNIFCLINSLNNLQKFFVKNNNNDKLIKLKKSLEKLQYDYYMDKIKEVNQERINSYIKEMNDKNVKVDLNNLENYYLVNFEIIEKKYEKLFSMNNKDKIFFIDNKSNKKEILTEKKNNLIKLKNSISEVLGNYRILDTSDFSLSESSSLIEIFSELKKYVNLPNYTLNITQLENSTNINICNLHLTLILDYINKIPEEYKEKNYQKLFNELYSNIIDSINVLNFEKLNIIKNKFIFTKNALNYYEERIKDIKEIIVNENIKIITERIVFLADFKFIYEDNEKIFELKQSKEKDFTFEGNYKYNNKTNFYTLKTIAAFAKFFPNLSNYQYSMSKNPLHIINELSINQKLKAYFNSIKAMFTSSVLIGKNQFNELYQEKIINYVMDKIYEKIYPPTPIPAEEKFLKIAEKITLNDLDKIYKKNYYNLDDLLPDIIDLFKKIKNARTPKDKYNYLKNILNYLTNIINLNEGSNKTVGADDIIPMLYVIFVKVKPCMFLSDLEYIKTFQCFLPYCDNDIIIFESIINKILNQNNCT